MAKAIPLGGFLNVSLERIGRPSKRSFFSLLCFLPSSDVLSCSSLFRELSGGCG